MARVRRLLLLLLVLVALVAPCGGPARAEDEPRDVPVTVEATVDAADLEATGRFQVRLDYTPLEDVGRPYRIELRLTWRGNTLLALDHSPQPPTPRWKRGARVSYTLPAPLPSGAGLEPGERVELRLGFFDPEKERTLPPRGDAPVSEGRRRIAQIVVPDLGPLEEGPRVDAILAAARTLAEAGRKADAWSALELGLRRAVEDGVKYRFRDALLALGHFEARPQSLLEQQVVAQRVEDERRRYLKLMGGRYLDRGKLFAALRILERVGGALAEQADAAVIGALADEKRNEKDLQDVRVRILGSISPEEKEKAAKTVEALGQTSAMIEKARAWLKERLYGRAHAALFPLTLSGKREVAEPARALLDEVDAAWLADTPEDEARLVEEALNHPAFERISVQPTHEFLYIGPKILVENVPELSRLRFDLAYLFLTDLFGRLPNPEGDRVTVFFKELWDFGGGVGGGKTIDIGNADPTQRGLRTDTGLLYHELTHCVDDTDPIYEGFREGLANFGAAYAFEALGQGADQLHAFGSNLEAFRKEYLGRDLEYWRIPNYGPSAGFFLHFVDKYAKRGNGHDWKPYRRFFRDYRAAPVRDGREPYVARALACYLVRAFGPGAFDDLVAFRFPLVESDREAVTKEVEAFADGQFRVRRIGPELQERSPRSPIPRDLLFERMISRFRGGDEPEEILRISKEELGIVHDWWVIGPFRAKGADPRACVFPPEYELDLAKEYVDDVNSCRWRKAGETGIVPIDAMGWVDFNFSYQDDTATYALTHVTVPEDVRVFVHVRADDDHVLFVNDRLVDGYLNRGRNASDWLWWRGPAEHVPDAMRYEVDLQRGRNRILLKVKNRNGPAGMILALSGLDGRPVPGLVTDADPPASGADTVATAKGRGAWKSVVKHDFRNKAFGSKLETAVGGFKVLNKRLVGEDTGKGVAWRKYTVRPGFPKDSPSNLFWLKEKHTADVEDFRLTLDLAPDGGGVPKVAVTFQGEGGSDGLSGWTLIVHPAGKDVAARLERYDWLVYQTPPLEAPGGEVQALVLTLEDGRFSATLGTRVLFDARPIVPIRGPRRIGVSTWGPNPGLESFELEVPK
jgi:hypothetical protein